MKKTRDVSQHHDSIITNNNDTKNIYYILFLFVLSRILFFSILFWVESTPGLQFEQSNIYLQYDGQHYYNIALNGYTSNYEYAFFPLFPMIMRCFSYFGATITGTLIMNHALTLLIAYALYLTGRKVMKKNTTECLSISLLWIFSPLSIATCILYSEALFVFLTVISYYFYKRNHFVLAGIALGLSIATRSLGSMLFFSIFLVMIYILFKNRTWNDITNIFKLFVPATVIGILYPIYLYVKLNNWHYFMDVQFIYWGRIKTNIVEMIIKDFSNIDDINMIFIYTYIALGICLYILFNAIKTKEDPTLILYLLFSILITFSTSREIGLVASASFYRYLFGCSSVYLLINHEIKLKPIIIITTTLCIFALIIFCIGGFVI